MCFPGTYSILGIFGFFNILYLGWGEPWSDEAYKILIPLCVKVCDCNHSFYEVKKLTEQTNDKEVV